MLNNTYINDMIALS